MPKAPIVILTAFYKPFVSGAELCVQEMVKHSQGRDLLIITSRLSRASAVYDKDGEVDIIRVGFGYSWDKYLYPVLCIWPVLKAKPRVVHAVMESYAGIGLMLIKWIKPSVTAILTLQSGNLDEDRKLQKGILAWIWRFIHTAPDKITAISHYLADRAIRIRGSGADVIVIPNGVDLALARQTPKVPVPDRIVCISRLSEEKGVDVLIDAFVIVNQRVPRSELHIVGEGSSRVMIEEQIRKLNLTEKVILYGRLPHEKAISIIASGQVFALLSRGEGQGIVLLEAASMGLPSVATRVGGIPEAVLDGQTGYLVPNEDAQTAASRLIDLLQDENLRVQMGATAEEFAKQFDWEVCIAKYHDLWDTFN